MLRRMMVGLWLLAGTMATLPCTCAQQSLIRSDLLITDALLLGSPDPMAIAVQGSSIVAVIPMEDAAAWVGPKTRQRSARLASVTPGFNDAHAHFLSGSLSLNQINLLEATTLSQLEETIRDYVNAHPELDCIVGRGWVYGAFPEGLPTRQQLDEWIPNKPAIMRCYDGHTAWVNTAALQLAKIDGQTPDPPQGIIVRDASGEPTGVLKESAQNLIESIMPVPSRSEKKRAIQAGIQLARRYGITSVQEAGMSPDDIQLFEELRLEGQLPMRFYFALEGKPNMSEREMDALNETQRRFPHLRIGAVKMYADGVIEAHTAALLAPYANRNSKGLPEFTQSDLDRIISTLDSRGWQIMVHAIGDGGVRMVLDAYELAAQKNGAPPRGRRHRLEHLESISQEDIARVGSLGVIASMQPFHADPNSNIFQVWAVNLGAERASRAWCWKSLQDAGSRLAFGTDWPVVGLDPRQGLHTAMTRQTRDRQPPTGFIPAQRLPLIQAVNAYTLGSAYAEFEEHRKGLIAPGMLADLVIWNASLEKVESIYDARVEAVVFDGKLEEIEVAR